MCLVASTFRNINTIHKSIITETQFLIYYITTISLSSSQGVHFCLKQGLNLLSGLVWGGTLASSFYWLDEASFDLKLV